MTFFQCFQDDLRNWGIDAQKYLRNWGIDAVALVATGPTSMPPLTVRCCHKFIIYFIIVFLVFISSF